MTELTIYLKSLGGFKDGTPRSDTLFGALCWGIYLFYGDEVFMNFLKSYQENEPAVLLSSSFPFFNENNNLIHLFPKICSQPIELPSTVKDYKIAKRFIKSEYIDGAIFQEIIDNGYGEQYLWDNFLQGSYLMSSDGKIISKKKIEFLPFKSQIIPGNAIDRINAGTIKGKLYHTRELFFSSNGGVFILLRCADNWVNKILAIFRFFGDKGIGGDFSVGKGCYTLEVKEKFPFNEPKEGTHWVTLSLYYPTNEEWQYYRKKSYDCWYKIAARKGKIESSFSQSTDIWKKTVIMVEEGSTFPVIRNQKIYGSLPVVKEMANGVKILQYGLGFVIRIR